MTGCGLDSTILPLEKFKGFSLVQSVDFFYPLVDDPFILGRIAFANVVSDLYAVGVLNIDCVSMVLSSCTEFTEQERDVVIPMLIDGFKDGCKEAQCRFEIKQIIENPWCMIGGIATSLSKDDEIVFPTNAQPGDLIILTKPLGTQLGTNAYIWMTENHENWSKLKEHFNEADILQIFDKTIASAKFLNRTAARLMHKYNATAATDVTGFGLLGHAQNLCDFQQHKCNFIIEKLPFVRNVLKIGEILNRKQKLITGYSVETSGGLFLTLPAKNAESYCNEFKLETNGEMFAWIIGYVTEGNGCAELVENPTFVEF